MSTRDPLLDDLTDAIARGRLAPAEVASIAPRELDAIFELGAERLDTDRDEEAAEIFAGLVVMFPYSARNWRAYGVASQRLLQMERARAAYDAALLLEPDHPEVLVYRGEVLLCLGELAAARDDLYAVLASYRTDLHPRAAGLLAAMEGLANWRPEPTRRRRIVEAARFETQGGRALPLRDGRFSRDDVADDERPITREVTNTARVFVPGIGPGNEEEVTATMGSSAAAPGDSTAPAIDTYEGPNRRPPVELRGGDTAPVDPDDRLAAVARDRRPDSTAIIQRRQLKQREMQRVPTAPMGRDQLPGPRTFDDGTETAPISEGQRAGLAQTPEKTARRVDTAIVRRRMGLPLAIMEDEDTETHG